MRLVTAGSIISITSIAFAAACSSGPTDTSRTQTAAANQTDQTATKWVPHAAEPQSQKEWRKAMTKAAVPKAGCYRAVHPSTTWEEVPCETTPVGPMSPRPQGTVPSPGASPQIVNNFTDLSTTSGTLIDWAEGSFPSITGLTDEHNSDGSADSYSLQINSNTFTNTTTNALCHNASVPANCSGWEQFVYQPGALLLEYWLLNYGNSCPQNWKSLANTPHCYIDSPHLSVPSVPITSLGDLTLTGTAGSSLETVVLSTGDGALYRQTSGSTLGLATSWTIAEFNVFGKANLSEAYFNAGTTIVVQTIIDGPQPSTIIPSCNPGGFTGETNSLSVAPNSCCTLGNGIQFTESNAPTAQSLVDSYITASPSSITLVQGANAVDVSLLPNLSLWSNPSTPPNAHFNAPLPTGIAAFPTNAYGTLQAFEATPSAAVGPTQVVVTEIQDGDPLCHAVPLQITVAPGPAENASPPGCTLFSTCSSEYYPAGLGRAAGYYPVETVTTAACTTPPALMEESIGGTWTKFGGFQGNALYPPNEPGVFYAQGQPGSLQQFRACSDPDGNVCDPAFDMPLVACPAPSCTPSACDGKTCGVVPDGCGDEINCGCPGGTCGSDGTCSYPPACAKQQCAAGTEWDQSTCSCAKICSTPACVCGANGGTWNGHSCE